MKMALQPHILLTATVLCGLALAVALPGDLPRWCRCSRTTRAYISPKHFQRLEVISPGAYCRQTEIIVRLKNNKTVCVAPEAKWINRVIQKLMQSKENVNSTQISPTASGDIVTRS
ncbi:alveolar macrophage chemotactic factor-like isoform X1 [Clupea harengus]|uniref:Alveolar macrophage chemotactic factor-like isoform X1 n=1 Tax=Clupea harengus TaxID=7950 RepID=A0A6P8FSJ9_CLUHA|nr:alveolar macrophage chemotactic factor-like isoform X1 [Clupea harengus]